jgi:hypothetical protein
MEDPDFEPGQLKQNFPFSENFQAGSGTNKPSVEWILKFLSRWRIGLGVRADDVRLLPAFRVSSVLPELVTKW